MCRGEGGECGGHHERGGSPKAVFRRSWWKHGDRGRGPDGLAEAEQLVFETDAPSAASAAVKADDGGGGTSTFADSVFNLTNNVAGAGLLTLPAGMASSACGRVPSVLLCFALAHASATTFVLIGRSCELTGERTFRGLWTASFGGRAAYVVDLCAFCGCFLCCAIYIGLLGDICSGMLREGGLAGAVPGVFESVLDFRSRVILWLAGSVLFPLNMIKDLSSLSFTSILGLGAVVYTVAFMIYRANDGSYLTEDTGGLVGKYVEDGKINPPSFGGSTNWNVDLRALVLVSNLGLAFVAHYNAPAYYHEMKKTNSKCFPRMVRVSYAILAMIYVAAMCAGYYTFGDTAKGNILLNYHPQDALASFGEIATGASLTFGFPLVSNGAMEGLKNTANAFGHPEASGRRNRVLLVVAMLLAQSALAILVKDTKIIAGFSGAATGSFLVYICPSLIYCKIVKQCFGMDSPEYKRGRRCILFVPFGTFICIMGVVMTWRSMKSE